MIGKLKGTVDSYGEDHLVLDVHGVGYLVHCSGRTLQALPAAGGSGGAVHRDFVREARFACSASNPSWSANGSACFRRCRASGAKTALAILSTLKPAELGPGHRAGRQGDHPPARRRRAARRDPYRDRTKGQDAQSAGRRPAGGAACGEAPVAAGGALSDAVSALHPNLGMAFAPQATAAVAAAARSAGEGASAETLIRLGLRELAR